jgi:lipoprotein
MDHLQIKMDGEKRITFAQPVTGGCKNGLPFAHAHV